MLDPPPPPHTPEPPWKGREYSAAPIPNTTPLIVRTLCRLGDEVGFDHDGRVWCVSDLHIDTKSGPNYRWLEELPEYPNDALICAGDIWSVCQS